MNQDRCLLVLEGYGVGPNMRRLICQFWDEAQMVCRASGNYGVPFKASQGVTHGVPLSSKLFNLLVDAVAQEWMVWLPLGGATGHGEQYLDKLMQGFLAISYVDDTYFASRDPVFLQSALSILVKRFEHVGLETNRLKTQAMVCTPGKIWTQLPAASYHCMRLSFQTSKQWEAHHITCSHCDATLQARSLSHHLATLHGVYQQTLVAKELLDECECVMYKAIQYPGS